MIRLTQGVHSFVEEKREITDLYVRDYPNCESERLSSG